MSGNKRPSKLSPAEFEIMEVIWSAGEAGITDVMRQVNRNREAPLKRATIQVQLRRLESKGWLRHIENGRLFVYLPNAGRDEASAELAEDVTARVFNGSCASLVRCLFEQQKLDPEDIERLRALIEEADADNGGAGR